MAQRIHLVFKTHLDVGFTDFARVVLNNYFKNYIPAAMKVAKQMRESDSPERFIWTTGSFLIYEYLEQGNAVERKQMEEAILAGDIAWHALPFTTHTELMDADLFRFGLSLSQELDARFGKKTIAAKMTDVPGHTRAIIPLLAEAGVEFLHIGVNPGSTIPVVPPLFRWQDPTGAEILVMYESGYGNASTIEGIEDCLAFGHTGDNLGPQSPQQVLDVYDDFRRTFPGADVFASTLDQFAEALLPIRKNFPVVTQEIGDTWIHGVGTDPIKVSQFKELSRLRSQWIREAPELVKDARFKNFSRRLLMVPEHTWGIDEKTYLNDYENYSAKKFSEVRYQRNFMKFQSSWVEKRLYPQEAVNALEDHPLAAIARSCLQSIRPQRPQLDEWQELNSRVVDSNGIHAEFDPLTGALTSFNGSVWTSGSEHPLAWLRYQTFSDEDYQRFIRQYILVNQQTADWVMQDFSKPGLNLAQAESRFWQPKVHESYSKQTTGEISLLFHLLAEVASNQNYGCPKDFWLRYTFHAEKPEIEIDLQWFNKPACRMPEALWLSFIPVTDGQTDWSIEKMGQKISPGEVVEKGNRHLHSSGQYVCWTRNGSTLKISSLDAPLVAPGKPSLLDFNDDPPRIQDGMHFNLLNNLWGTNFPMWFEEDCHFRFQIRFN